MMKRRNRRSYSRDNTGHSRVKSLGSGLDEIGFQPLGRRISIEKEHEAEGSLKHSTPSGAYYDHSSGRIVIEFTNGAAFMVPARSLQGLVDALESDISEVELIGGKGLYWERLEVEHEIELVMNGSFGTPDFMRRQRS
ncbi:DUF2442 domain-containing protein [Shinella sp. G-2]|uniref:DUF2442 domain-containing protein n=1 Tax=Shinella sp. G-2 TaxID=3133141 RepID=UPI003D005F30